jgi:hypothetical protein
MTLLGRKQSAMQQVMQPRPMTMNCQPLPSRQRRQEFIETLIFGLTPSVLALLVVPAILGRTNLLAQTHAPQATKSALRQKAAEPAQPRRTATETIATPPPVSPAPILPANQARVSWDSRGLEIEASNSSLKQILHQVAAATGGKLEGLTQDQRVYGSYGPGPERDVVLKLLDGSGYNVLMIGGRGTDAPLKIVLSARSPAGPQTAASQNRTNSQDDQAAAEPEPEPQPEDPTEQPRPEPVQNPFGIGEPPRDPQEFMQEILQRQQKIDEQQQQQQGQQNDPQQ